MYEAYIRLTATALKSRDAVTPAGRSYRSTKTPTRLDVKRHGGMCSPTMTFPIRILHLYDDCPAESQPAKPLTDWTVKTSFAALAGVDGERRAVGQW